MEQQACVIAVCGAGGKSTYIRRAAQRALAEGKRAAVATTTHIFAPGDAVYLPLEEALLRLSESGKEDTEQSESIPCAETAEQCGEKLAGEAAPINRHRAETGARQGVVGADLGFFQDGILYAGRLAEESGKMTALSADGYQRLLAVCDIVLVEADGARRCPIKIPDRSHEPVIPEGVREIVVVMGAHAVGRRFGAVCHRAELACRDPKLASYCTPDTVVTEELIRHLAEDVYLTPLSREYPGVTCSLSISRMEAEAAERGRIGAGHKLALILMASGFGRRFGANKLMAEYCGKPLYQAALSMLTETKERLLTEGIGAEVILVTRYPEIAKAEEIRALLAAGKLRLCENPDYEEGIAGSVRNGAKCARALGCTDFLYMAGDMPHLPWEETVRYVRQYLASGNGLAVMCAGKQISNPGILSARYYDELMRIQGDRGGMQVIRRYPADIYHYQVPEEYLMDIDCPEALCAAQEERA